MLGIESNSIGSLSIESGSGGVRVIGGKTAGISDAPTFDVSEDIPSFDKEKKPAQFKAVNKTLKFKPIKEKKPEFKVVK
jgi:hypothetical protein